jgi:predicted CoA-binding protein
MNDEIRTILTNYKVVAVVGLSRDPSKDSYIVAKYLKEHGFKIVPLNPYADNILGEKVYPSLLKLPDYLKSEIDIVDIFRPGTEVLKIVDQAIELKREHDHPKVIWMQLGISNEEAANRALDAGLTVVMDECMMTQHQKLSKK